MKQNQKTRQTRGKKHFKRLVGLTRRIVCIGSICHCVVAQGTGRSILPSNEAKSATLLHRIEKVGLGHGVACGGACRRGNIERCIGELAYPLLDAPSDDWPRSEED